MKSIFAFILTFAAISAHADKLVCGNKTFVNVITNLTNDGEETILTISSQNGAMDWQHVALLGDFTGKAIDRGLTLSQILIVMKTSECPIDIHATAAQAVHCASANARIDLVGEGFQSDNDGSGDTTYTKKFPELSGQVDLDMKLDPKGITYSGKIVNGANGPIQKINVFGNCKVVAN